MSVIPDCVDHKKIKPSGTLPTTIVGQCIDAMKGKFDPAEEMELMQATIDSSDLNSSYTDINNTTAVVGGLVIAFCFSATQSRFTSADADITTIWSSLSSMKGVEDVYGLIIGLSLVASFFSIIYAMFMTTMLAQIPKSATNQFFEMVGNMRIQIVFALQAITVWLFLIATLLQITANYSVWVSVIIIALVLVGAIFFLMCVLSVQVVRVELLRRVYEKNKKDAAGDEKGKQSTTVG